MPKQGRHTDFWCSGSNQSTEGAARNFLSGSFWVSYPSRTGFEAEECASILPESKALSLSWPGGKRMQLDRSRSTACTLRFRAFAIGSTLCLQWGQFILNRDTGCA